MSTTPSDASAIPSAPAAPAAPEAAPAPRGAAALAAAVQEASANALGGGSRLLSSFRPSKIAIFGSGSYATATACVLARNGHEVVILTRRKEVEESITRLHKNPACPLPDFHLPYNISCTTDAKKCLSGAAAIVHAIPVQSSFEYLKAMKDLIPEGIPIVNTSKGLYTETLELMTEVIPRALGRTTNPVICLSGPTFAAELVKGLPSGAVAACSDIKKAAEVAELFQSPTMRVWLSSDVVGVEVAGALKNVYALAAGTLEGLGLGFNTTALLVTRAIAEMTKLATALGGSETTLAGLSGVGDLVLTAFGSSSRNRTVGVRLGKGESLQTILSSMTEVAEGVATAPAALKLAKKHKVSVPIIEAINAVISGEVDSPLPALMALLSLPPGEENKASDSHSFARALSSFHHPAADAGFGGSKE